MRPRKLASQVLLIQIAIVAATVLASALISFWLVSGQVTDEYEHRSLAIGHSVAAMPDVIEAFADPEPSRAIQPIAEAIRKSEAASFVVVANVDGIRYSHPNPDLIGQRVSTDPSPALQGQSWVGIEQGTLGKSVRAKVPIFESGGKVIGIVSVGFLEDQVNATLLQSMPLIGANVALALGLGIAGSILLSRRLGRQTFGLQPSDIAALLEQRESTLHGIREGVLATDRDGRITLLNDEAKRLLGLEPGAEGRRIADVVPPGRMRDVLTGERGGADQMLLAGDRVLVANAVEAVASSGAGGWVEVAVQAGPEGVGVRVRDSGPGVGTAVAEEIFEEGFTTKTGTSHQGLGLALARQVAQRRGGWLRVSNEGGAVFTALLPADGSHAS